MRALTGTLTTLLVASGLAGGASAQESAADRIYARVVTASGEVREGYLRWDRNEASWADLLNGSKAMPREWVDEAAELAGRDGERHDGGGGFEIFGLRVSWDEDDWDAPRSAESGIRFGHLRSLAVSGDDQALLTLKSGEEIELRGGSTDLGAQLRSVVIEDAAGGSVDLRWRDLDVVEFMAAPAAADGPAARRLHGTLTDRWGNAYTGYVSWDLDEALTSDVLDGDERGRDREVPFGEVAAIERAGSCCARVVLVGGEELELDDSNDVDHRNRGIQVSDPSLGQVQVDWDAFASLRFHAPDRHAAYADFDGGRRLRGEVITDDGERWRGFVRWDNDESWSWELLDGEYRDVVYDVELGNV
ncbi:MAG: hypothetical protein KY453_07955, partial [Gemmatimonadetes bacterium]|nr:hypothetical protein [Gemmatimonadota bacterium]